MAAKPAYILAMKLKALERTTADDRDYRDCQARHRLRGNHGRRAARHFPEVLP
jgi:hypothetical protein